MVTEIFGIINLKDSAAVSERMAGSASYKVGHRWHETVISAGRLGIVMIGGTSGKDIKLPLLQSENLTICGDITLYNRKELEDKLQLSSGYIDTEMLLHAYRKWGYSCVDYLIGDFAFAIWDSEKQELFCARDHIGMRPFFYAQISGGFVFASELRMVIAGFETLPPLNNSFLLETLVTVISEKHETAFENIFRLPPAHKLIFSNGQLKVEKYWSLDTSHTIRYKTESEYIETFRELLIKAVEVRCSGVNHIASELSGGLDSGLVSCVAAGFAGREGLSFKAFSNTLPENHGTVMVDEKDHIQKVLDWKKFNWEEVNELSCTIPEIIEHTLQIQGCFTQQRFHMFNKGIYEAAGRFGAEILLSGFGGDEMVSARTGNAWFDLVREKQWQRFFDALHHNTFFLKAAIKGLKVIAHYHLKKNRQSGVKSGIFTPALLNRRLKALPVKAQFISENRLKERYFSKHQKHDYLFLADRQLQKADHPHVSQRIEYSCAAATQYGVQYRYPLLDIRLLQACLSFPAWIKNRPGQDRFLFRQAGRGLLPEEIRLRSDKTGAVIPQMYTRFQKDREKLSELFRHCSTDKFLNTVFDFSRFDTWMDRLLERNAGELNHLMPGAFYNHLMVICWFLKQSCK